jgi:hypothetical protein
MPILSEWREFARISGESFELNAVESRINGVGNEQRA